jgi:hypothetical protein
VDLHHGESKGEEMKDTTKDLIKFLVKFFIAYVAGAVFIIACMSSIIVIPTIVSRLTRPKVHEVTSPLETGVVRDLCQKLTLPEDDPLCQPGAIVYAPDFFPAVRASFEPGITTYDDIQGKLGSYQYECKPPVNLVDGTAYFRCWYDFKGDRVFPVVFIFTDDSILERLSATVGDDWP